jgi:hypothetical protein
LPFVNRKSIYTAVTRATKRKHVYFFEGPTVEYDEAALGKRLTKNCENYKKQNRALTDNYVTGAWSKGPFGKVCHDGVDYFRFDIKDGRVESNLTADRVDDDERHQMNNVVLPCVTCNQRKSCWTFLSIVCVPDL